LVPCQTSDFTTLSVAPRFAGLVSLEPAIKPVAIRRDKPRRRGQGWIGRINVSVSATEDKNFHRDAADCFGSQSGLADQLGSRHWITWCIMSPVTTARWPREKMLTQQCQGECSGVGVSVMVSSSAQSSSTSSAR
jgi:hypothetical protein